MPVGEGGAQTGQETGNARRPKRCRGGTRRDAGVPAGLRRVDVPHPSDHRLIEEDGLDGAAARGELRAQEGGCERRVFRLGPEAEFERHGRRVPVHGAERTGVHQHHPSPIVEVERDACVGRERRVAAIEGPVAVHPEMDEEHGTVVEVHELVLPSPLDGTDGAPLDGAGHGGRQTAPLGRMVRPNPRDPASAQRAAEPPDGVLDFR